jgi:pimeloyl-ACP methyl ester carboxylesterase
MRPFGCRSSLIALAVVLGSTASACRKPPARSDEGPPAASVTIQSAQLTAPNTGLGSPAPPEPKAKRPGTGIETINVPNDRSILVVVGADTGRPIVHLHGMCTEARSDLEAWGSSVSAFGTILALSGDATCSGGSGAETATWTSNVAAIDARIDAAIDAVQARGVKLDNREVILIGESMGASRAEALATRFPSKYMRLVLIGEPQAPSAKDLEKANAVALLAGEKEPQQNMVGGAAALTAKGLAARFWELPDATHGAYGSDGDRIMGDAVAFVAR